MTDETTSSSHADRASFQQSGNWDEAPAGVMAAALLLLDVVAPLTPYSGVAVSVQDLGPGENGVDVIDVKVTTVARPGPEMITITVIRPDQPPAGRAYVVTRYGGHRHVSADRVGPFVDEPGDRGRQRTLCRSTSSWTLASWAKEPDHPFLNLEAMAELPVCPDCMTAMATL